MSLRSFAARGVRKLRSLVRRHSQEASEPQRNTPPTCDVLYVNGCGPEVAALRRYRVTHQREQLELWGMSTDEVFYIDACAKDVTRGNAIVFYRCPITPGIEQLIEAARQDGKKIYFDVDDLVCDTSYTNELPVVKAMSPEDKAVFDDGVTRNGQTLALCDGATVTTERLATELLKVVPQVVINRNVASQEMVALSEKARASVERDPSVVTIGYFSGSMTHNADFAQALPALVTVMRKYPNVRLKVVGELVLPPELEPFSDRVICASRVDWKELPDLIASADINLAPLEPTLFNEAKSENKWLEASLVGVPTVASNFGAFAHALRNGETGLLCSNTNEWVDALSALVEDAAYRERIGTQALLWCLAHNTTATTGSVLADLFNTNEASINALLPEQEQTRSTIVSSFLAARGFSYSASSYDASSWKHTLLDQRLKSATDALNEDKKLVVFVYERDCGDDATFRYFGYNLVQRLLDSSAWHGVWIFVDELQSASDLLQQASCMVLVRCRIRPELVDLAQTARKHKISLGYLIDDYALGASTAPRIIQAMASDPSNAFEQDFWTGTTERFRLASELCAGLIVPVDFFAQLLEKDEVQQSIMVVSSSLNNEQVSIAKLVANNRTDALSDSRFIIGYFSGTSSHQQDFELVRPTLVRLLRENRDTCLLLGGNLLIDSELLPFLQSGQLLLMPRVDYVTLQYLQAAVDVVLAPLVVDDFTNCKSGLKVFEAGIVGTPACASPSAAYCAAIDNKVSGFICDTDDDWYQALVALRDNGELRAAMGEKARLWAQDHYYGATIQQQIEDACEQLAKLAPATTVGQVAAAIESKHVENWDDPFEASPAFAR